MVKCPFCGKEVPIEEYPSHVDALHMEEIRKRKPGVKIIPISEEVAKELERLPDFLRKQHPRKIVLYLVFAIDPKIVSENEILRLQKELKALSDKNIKYGIMSEWGRTRE